MALVTEAKLAQILNRQRTTIREAVESGRITQRPDKLFDSETAVREFLENTHHEKGHDNTRGPVAAPAEPGEGKGGYVAARTRTQHYEALIKRLRYEERAKNLTPAADVETARYTEFRTLREACFNIPSRIAALLAGETDAGRCQRMLEEELTGVFAAFADGKLAA